MAVCLEQMLVVQRQVDDLKINFVFQHNGRCGVSSVPDVREQTITFNDEFLILGSDGVWEHTNSRDVINVVEKGIDAAGDKPWNAGTVVRSVSSIHVELIRKP